MSNIKSNPEHIVITKNIDFFFIIILFWKFVSDLEGDPWSGGVLIAGMKVLIQHAE